MNHPDDIRSQLLREATRQFAAHGVDGTSIQAIAEAVGVTRPTLVYHFGSKAGLRAAVLEGVVAHWRAALPGLLLAAASGGPRLDRLLGALFGFFQDDPNLARLIVRELLDQPEVLTALLRAQLTPWTAVLCEAVRSGQAEGQLQPGVDPEAFVSLMISAAVAVSALGQHAGALVSPEPGLHAQQAELVRVARAALLVPRRKEG